MLRQQMQAPTFLQHVAAHLAKDVGSVLQGPHIGQGAGGFGVGHVHGARLLPVPGLGGRPGVPHTAAIVGLPGRVADVFVADHLFVVDRRKVTDEIVRLR